jgi:hypothetical protein
VIVRLVGVLSYFNPLNTELNSSQLLALLAAHHILHVSRIKVNYLEDARNHKPKNNFFNKN